MPLITLSARDASFSCDDDTIMRAAVRAGFGFPYECNVGSCGTCRFELVEGEIEHLRADAPASRERDRAKRRFLGCQARPLGPCTIKVTLDQKYVGAHVPRRTAARLVARTDVTHDIALFRFAPDLPCSFTAGQYALLTVPGCEGARAYSMSNRPGEAGDEWHFLIRRTPGGSATGVLFDTLAAGDAIGLDGPYGMAYLRDDVPRDILCLAGGSGLSPMVSIARAAAASPALAGRELHFIYGGRAPRDVCEEALLHDGSGVGARIAYHPSVSMPESQPEAGWTGRTGLVPVIAAEMFGDRLREMELYFAGPPAMAEAVLRLVIDRAIPPAQVHFDQFY